MPGRWKQEERKYDVEMEPTTMRSERPLGTWCGYKRTGEAHGETEKTGACGRNWRGKKESGTTSVKEETTKLPRSVSWSGERCDGTAAVVDAMEETQHERRMECVSDGVFAACLATQISNGVVMGLSQYVVQRCTAPGKLHCLPSLPALADTGGHWTACLLGPS